MKNTGILVPLIFSVFAMNISAQNAFHQTMGDLSNDNARDIKQTSDNGYVMVGSSDYNGPDTEIIIGKTDGWGILQWANSIGLPQFDEIATSVDQTIDGGYVIAGTIDSSGFTNYSILVLKMDSMGTVQWGKTYGGTGEDAAWGIQQTTDGGFMINGLTNILGSGNYSTYLIKTDANGSVQWNKTFFNHSLYIYSSCKQISDGGYIVCGDLQNLLPYYKSFIFKADSLGTIIWCKYFSGNLWDIASTVDGGFIVTGRDSGIVLIKLSNSGSIQWAKSYNNIFPTNEGGSRVEQTSDSGFLISGTSNNTGMSTISAFLIKTDSSGTLVWSRLFGSISDHYESCVAHQTTDEGFVIGTTSDYNGDEDFYIIKTDSNGYSGCLDTVGTFSASAASVFDSTIIIIPSSAVTTSVISLNSIAVQPLVNVLCSSNINGAGEDYFLSIYPNPAASTIIIDTYVPYLYAEILNLQGSKIYSFEFASNRQVINCSTYPSGIYFLRVIADEKQWMKKLIIQ